MTAVAATLTWPGLAFRNITPTKQSADDRLDRDFFVEAGLVGGDARITVRRDSPEDAGFREVFVSLDGKELAILRHGESVTTEIPPGPHRLRAHNTLFWKTFDLVLKPGEHARFLAVNRSGFGTFSLLFLLGAMPVYLTLEREHTAATATRPAR
jgi:hypothetical protein